VISGAKRKGRGVIHFKKLGITKPKNWYLGQHTDVVLTPLSLTLTVINKMPLFTKARVSGLIQARKDKSTSSIGQEYICMGQCIGAEKTYINNGLTSSRSLYTGTDAPDFVDNLRNMYYTWSVIPSTILH